jgi:hypothetical protein
VRIGAVRSGGKAGGGGLLPLPSAAEDMQALLHAELAAEAATPSPPRSPAPVAPPSMAALSEAIAHRPPPAPLPEPAQQEPAQKEPVMPMPEDHQETVTASEPMPPAPDQGTDLPGILAEMAAQDGVTFRPLNGLFRDFAILCRQRGVPSAHVDITLFRRLFAFACARLDRLDEASRTRVESLAERVEDDVLAPYLAICVASVEGHSAPDEDELARVYGSSSPGRVRRMLEHLERQGLIVVREDFGGERSISVPGLASGLEEVAG